jgi:hypothetical protein
MGQSYFNKELEEMSKKQVWEIIKKEEIPQNRRTIICNWIFRIRKTEFIEQDWWIVDSVKFLELSLMTSLLQSSTMLTFES